MVERDYSRLSAVYFEQNTSTLKPVHGVTPETHGLLLFARIRKDILELLDISDKGKRIISPTRNLLYIYYFNDISIRDLKKHVGGDRVTNGKRMLEALEIIWENVPPEVQLQYSKEKAVRLKESSLVSPRTLKKLSENAKTIWQRKDYREKNKKSRKDNPYFIRHMSEVKKGQPSPAKGKVFTGQALESIRKGAQKRWNRQHGIELDADRSMKRKILLNEWIRLTQLLGHTPSYPEVNRLKKNNQTEFSETPYQEEFGKGNYTQAKELLTCLADIQTFAEIIFNNPLEIFPRPVTKKGVSETQRIILDELYSILRLEDLDEIAIKALALKEKTQRMRKEISRKRHAVLAEIGNEEQSMWEAVAANNLEEAVLEQGIATKRDLDLVREFFEKGLIGERLNTDTLTRFSLAFVRATSEIPLPTNSSRRL